MYTVDLVSCPGYQQSTAPAVAGVQQPVAYTGYSAYSGPTASQQPVAAGTTYPGYSTASTGTANTATSQPQPLIPATGYAAPAYGVAPPTQPTGGYGAGAATGQYGVQQPAAPPQHPPPTGQVCIITCTVYTQCHVVILLYVPLSAFCLMDSTVVGPNWLYFALTTFQDFDLLSMKNLFTAVVPSF